MDQSTVIEVFAPAKVNFFLGVTGMRADGYHSLVSWVAPLAFGDMVRLELDKQISSDTFSVEGAKVDCALDDNLVWKALAVFRVRVPQLPPVSMSLTKRIPFGAGLGGGSSDAVATLKGLNFLSGHVLSSSELVVLAESLGSDCPLFLEEGASIIRGRGDQVKPLSSKAFSSVRLLLFKPFLGVDTAWAYAQLRARGKYLSPENAEVKLEACLNAFGQADCCFYNSFEEVVFGKMLGLGLLIENLRSRGVACGLSGSGSACFAIIKDDAEGDFVRDSVRYCWGENAFIVETHPLS